MKKYDNRHSKQVQRHLDHCQRVYNQMKQDGTWPWKDSTLLEDLVESDDTHENV